MRRRTRSLVGVAWALALVVSGAVAEETLTVSPDGPFPSLTAARDRIRERRAAGYRGPVSVEIRGGVYDLAEPLVLEPIDSAPDDGPVTWRAAPGEPVTLRGGRVVTGWLPWRDGIYQADLGAQGLGDAVFWQLFYDGARMELARHPNADPEHPRTGGFAYVEDSGPVPSETFVYEPGALDFEHWGDCPQAEVVAVYALGWNFAITPITAVDVARRVVTVRRVRSGFLPNNRFYVRNALALLDAPGEWYHDRAARVLYFRPPNGEPIGEVVIPVLDQLIETRGRIAYPHGYLNVAYHGSKAEFPLGSHPPDAPVSNHRFVGLRLEIARQNGFRLVGARRCEVLGCRVTNIGNVGINLGGVVPGHVEVGNPRAVEMTGTPNGVGGAGQDLLANDPCLECRVEGCDVWSVGSDGIFLYGAGNVAENNHVCDIGLFDKDCAGVNLFGEDNVARRNTIHDLPRNAIFLKGTGNVVEGNDIHHTVLETCDGGAIRMCQRNLVLRDNVIRDNRIVDTPGYGYPQRASTYQSPYFTWGVYLDDFTCGTTVAHNLIVRTGRGGVHVHGGSDNLVEGNVVVDPAQYGIEVNPIRDDQIRGNLVRGNVIAYLDGDRLAYRIGRWVDGAVVFERNVLWAGGGEVTVGAPPKGVRLGWADWLALGVDSGSIVADPLFVDPGRDDYRAQPGSVAATAGPRGPVGCYESPARATWPLAGYDPRREQPLIRVAPVRPVDDDFELDAVGRPPRHGDVSAPPRAPITVTDEVAHSGRHSLAFVDAADLPYPWQPRIFYPVDYRAGRVRLRLSFRMPGAGGARFGIDPRQYSDAGGREYLTGPQLTVFPDGRILGPAGLLATVPMDTWCTLDLVMILGDAAVARSELTIAAEGQAAERVLVPHVTPGFTRLERVVILCPGNDAGRFWIDDVYCGPAD